jgi:hypothetical protein
MKVVNQTIIEPKQGWQLINWQELREYKDLFLFSGVARYQGPVQANHLGLCLGHHSTIF